MTRRTSADQLRSSILRLCAKGSDGRALRIAVIGELRRVFRFDCYVWVVTDPASCVGVDPLAEVPGVRELASAIRLKYATPVNRWTTLTDVASLGSGSSASPLWREVQEPLGILDVVSAVFRDQHGCWGFLDLWLTAPLEPGDLEVLTSVLPDITAALRAAYAAALLRRPPSEEQAPPGPATLLMDDDLRIQGRTPGMDDRLQQLLPHPEGLSPVPAAALNVAAQLLAFEQGIDAHEPVARAHLGDGHWVAVRAARLNPSGLISVAVEPTTAPERVDLFTRAFGLTSREAEIVRHVARGLDTVSMAHQLHLAPYTVQDHLKSIFAKTGVASRRDLMALLAG